MLILYGLGNNDLKYFDTKHNAGRIVLENMTNTLKLNFQKKDTFAFAKTEINSEEVYFLYSMGYMNNSGNPLQSFCNYFKIDFRDINNSLLILQDDSDQLETKIKLLPGGGSAGHHGINSIYQYLDSLHLVKETIWRLKIGIRPVDNKTRSETFVLKNLSQNELKYYLEISATLVNFLPDIAKNNFLRAQTALNQSLTLAET